MIAEIFSFPILVFISMLFISFTQPYTKNIVYSDDYSCQFLLNSNNGLNLDQDRFIPPIPPSNIHAKNCKNFFILSWNGTGSDIIKHYIIYRRSLNLKDWHKTSIVLSIDDNRGLYEFEDHNIMKGVIYEYVITAVDRYGNESKHSNNIFIGSNQ